MNAFDPLTIAATLALILISAIVLWLRLSRPEKVRGLEPEPDQHDPNGQRVIIGLDFSTSMKHRVSQFVPAWLAFVAEQQTLIGIRYRLYRMTGCIEKLNVKLLVASELPTWNEDSFLRTLSRGTAIYQFVKRACDRARLWKEEGFEGNITVLLFTDGFPDSLDKLYIDSAKAAIDAARKSGVRFRVYAYIDADLATQVRQIGVHLNLVTADASTIDPNAELILLPAQGLAAAMRDASQIIRIPPELRAGVERTELGARIACDKPQIPRPNDTQVGNSGECPTLQ